MQRDVQPLGRRLGPIHRWSVAELAHVDLVLASAAPEWTRPVPAPGSPGRACWRPRSNEVISGPARYLGRRTARSRRSSSCAALTGGRARWRLLGPAVRTALLHPTARNGDWRRPTSRQSRRRSSGRSSPRTRRRRQRDDRTPSLVDPRGRPHPLELLGHPDRGHPTPALAGQPVQVRAHHLQRALALARMSFTVTTRVAIGCLRGAASAQPGQPGPTQPRRHLPTRPPPRRSEAKPH